MSKYEGRIISATKPTVSLASASGIWTAEEVLRYEKESVWPESGEVDIYFNQTVLLLKGDGNQGATNLYNPGPTKYLAFSDNSNNNFPITVFGDAYGTTISPYQATFSNYFDGTGFLNTTTISGANLAGDFTMECWVYLPNVSGVKPILDARSGNNTTAWTFYINGSAVEFFPGGSVALSFAASLTANTWTHISIVRSGTSLSCYNNGTLIGSQTLSGSITASGTTYKIGNYGSGDYFVGHLSNLRFVNGTAIIPPTGGPSSNLTAVANTVLLTCRSNRFIDNSTNNFTINRNSNVSVSHFQPFTLAANDNGSGYFDGNGDYLQTTSTANLFNWTSTDYTLEAWIYPTTLTGWHYTDGANNNPSFIGNMSVSNSGNYWSFGPVSNGTVKFYYYNGSTNSFSSSQTVTINAWNHIAFIKNSSGIKIFVNGVGTTYGTISGTPLFGSDLTFNIGQANNTSINGYVSNVRIVKGTAVYTDSFTPPTAPLTAVTNTSLLALQYNGTVRNVGFIDSSPNYFPITRVGNTTQGTFSPFSAEPGKWSNYFGSGNYLNVGSVNSADFTYTGDFTFEFWIYFNTIAQDHSPILALKGSPEEGYSFYWRQSDSVWRLYSSSLASVFDFSYTPTVGVWTHVALSRSGSSIRCFVNGSQIGSTLPCSGTISPAASVNPLQVGGGQYAGTPINGHLSNLRIIKGTALYTSNFTVPSGPLTSITNTVLLTCQSNRFVDNNSQTTPKAITITGSPRVTPFSPFAPTAEYSAGTNGGSGYFDSSGDWLNCPTGNSNLTLGSDNYTIDFWMYPIGSLLNKVPITSSRTSTLTGAFLMQFDSTSLRLWINNVNLTASSTNATINLFSWSHVRVCRSGSNYYFYLNGTLVNNLSTSSASLTQADWRIGSWFTTTTHDFPGYITDIRIIKGTALDTGSSISIPTAPLTTNANTQLLLNFTNSGILDQTGKNNLETVGNAQIDTSIKKYNIGSMKFDGTDDRLVFPPSPNVAFGTGDFTIEAWVYTLDVSSATQRGWFQTSDTAGGLKTDYNSGIVSFFGSISSGSVAVNVGGTNYISSANIVATSTWYHVAITRTSGTVRVFLNGNIVASGSNNTANLTSQYLVVGGYYSTSFLFNGYIDDFRITHGLSRYPTTFTPPPLTLPNR